MNNFNHLGLRSITYTIDLDKIFDEKYQEKIKNDVTHIKNTFCENNISVRTVRLNTKKISYKRRIDEYVFLKKIQALSDFSKKVGIRWFNIAFDLIGQDEKNVKNICQISYKLIKKHQNAFVNFIISNYDQINSFAALAISQTILDISKLSFNGYDNFRVGVSLNPSRNTPFFPFSYSEKDRSFSLAVEITERMLNCIKLKVKKQGEKINLKELEKEIFEDLKPFVVFLDKESKIISKEKKINYGGQDLSLAPYPEEKISVVEIIKTLGVDDIGSNGTIFFTSYLTGIVKSLTEKNNAKPARL